jgi:hypothetical protein
MATAPATEPSSEAEPGDKTGKPDKASKAERTGRRGPGVIVNMTEAERGFPIGSYAKVLDAKGSPAHSIRTLRLLPGLNLADRAVVDQARAALTGEDFDKLGEHPDFRRLLEQGVLKVYGSRGEVPRSERGAIAALTVDMDVLELWGKAEDDGRTRTAIAARVQELREQGLHEGDQQIQEHRPRTGQDVQF